MSSFLCMKPRSSQPAKYIELEVSAGCDVFDHHVITEPQDVGAKKKYRCSVLFGETCECKITSYESSHCACRCWVLDVRDAEKLVQLPAYSNGANATTARARTKHDSFFRLPGL